MKRYEHLDAAAAEAIRLGAILIITGKKGHFSGLLEYNGKRRKVTFSSTPNGLCCRSVETYVRRVVRGMMG